MSIWNQLEIASNRDRDFLSRARGILLVVRAQPGMSDDIIRKIDDLEREVASYRRDDHRFNIGCVPFDIKLIPGFAKPDSQSVTP